MSSSFATFTPHPRPLLRTPLNLSSSSSSSSYSHLSFRCPSKACFPSLTCRAAADHQSLEREILEVAFLAAAYANVLWFKSGFYNVQVVVREDEPEESLLRRFRREVFKAGIIRECKRRRFFEDAHDRRKRKNRDAAARNRRRRPRSKSSQTNREEASKAKKVVAEEEDNWELPECELPY